MGSLPLMKKGALQPLTGCGIQHRNEPKTGRHCLDQTADLGYLESAEVDSHRLSGPSFGSSR